MSAKPTCPDCGSTNINALYSGVTLIKGDGTVAVGGVTGGTPIEWDCYDCDTFERTDHLKEIADQVYGYWCVARGHQELESGYDWRLA